MNYSEILLSVLIPTIKSREVKFTALKDRLVELSKGYPVEIVSLCDNKEMSIGEKRQKLYESAKGIYSVQVDDDDDLSDSFFEDVMPVCKTKLYDCITYLEVCSNSLNNATFFTNHSLSYDKWAANIGGFRFVRTPFCKDVLLTEKCVLAGVPFIRWNEDEQFAERIKPLLNKEFHIGHALYKYQYSFEEFNSKYGISK